MKKNSGVDLWERAQKVIPGGNMLLSKRSEQFLPGAWPSYFKKASGCHVWDLDGNKYTDVSIMGIGTNILGYGHPEVDEVVRNVVNDGNMSTFNCPEEVYLAEKLVEMHPWADMVKFARSGGEANSIAIRIARAASGKDNVAMCGYHGWHDWYLAANLGNSEGLDGHLLPGLPTSGVPRGLQSTIFPFSYNNIDELELLVRTKNIGIIKMEVSRSEGPQNGFLEKVRALATKNNVVLIFDECTSGFRETFGGLHKKYGVEPDLAVFGKAIGNGYALTAVIGKQEVMEYAQASFISSTFWTERIGPAAACRFLGWPIATGGTVRDHIGLGKFFSPLDACSYHSVLPIPGCACCWDGRTWQSQAQLRPTVGKPQADGSDQRCSGSDRGSAWVDHDCMGPRHRCYVLATLFPWAR